MLNDLVGTRVGRVGRKSKLGVIEVLGIIEGAKGFGRTSGRKESCYVDENNERGFTDGDPFNWIGGRLSVFLL